MDGAPPRFDDVFLGTRIWRREPTNKRTFNVAYTLAISRSQKSFSNFPVYPSTQPTCMPSWTSPRFTTYVSRCALSVAYTD